MDKLTAYQVLRLDSNASVEEVKEAYARLSKEYHPEENPEDFQQLHEAYVTLTRGGRRGNRAMIVETSPIEKMARPEAKDRYFDFGNIKKSEVETNVEEQNSDLVFRNIKNVETEENVEEPQSEMSFDRSLKNAEEQQEEIEEQIQFDFDASIQQAQKSEEEQFLLNTQMCIKELETLFALPNCNDVKRFKQFFGRKEYTKVFYTPQSKILLPPLAQYLQTNMFR